jgi:hypothetical protein
MDWFDKFRQQLQNLIEKFFKKKTQLNKLTRGGVLKWQKATVIQIINVRFAANLIVK